MPVNSASESKRFDKKLSLSLNRTSRILSLANVNHSDDTKENLPNVAQERPQKRPLSSTYLKTLNAAKKLKTTDGDKTEAPKEEKLELVVLQPKSLLFAMLNGDHISDGQYGNASAAPKKMPVASLSNLGNTCFLNSVLYTLRYAPRFLHNLHHLVADLQSVDQKLGSIRLKSSSLGRSAAGLAASGTRSWSSKDLLALGQNESNTGKSKIQIATEKLHETFASMRLAETKCVNSSSADATPEPFAADAFLTALRDVNSIFEGNRQQDAHELLICVLSNIRDTCRALHARAAPLHAPQPHSNGLNRQPSLESESSKPTLASLRKSWKRRKEKSSSNSDSNEERDTTPPGGERERPPPGWDFVAEDFEGTMVVRTRCMECERWREHRQAASDVSVAVPPRDAVPEPYRAAATAPDTLTDQNKYWCGFCLRYVEARRTVSYARLPKLLVLQLKRFSGGMQKITQFAPTPINMPCFCETCVKRAPKDPPLHRYTLWAVIMHLGQSLTGGHYLAYARHTSSPQSCEGGCSTHPTSTAPGFMRTLFNRGRQNIPPSGCAAKECCIPRAAPNPVWLSCDDETVKPLTDSEMEDLLSEEPKLTSAATPYLLFYARNEVG